MAGTWLVCMIFLFVLPAAEWPPAAWPRQALLWWPDEHLRLIRARHHQRVRRMKGCAVAARPAGKAVPELPRYLWTTEVAAILQVSPKTVPRWAKEGKLPFLRTLGGHRRYPASEIRQLAEELRIQPMA
jgi:excisionase family DNA binding protein